MRAVKDTKCSYSCALNSTLGKELYQSLIKDAPIIDKCKVSEVIVNKYLPGDYIPAHQDIATYAYNMVITMQTGEDGIMIEDKFYSDIAGRIIIFKGRGLIHSVPPVNKKRYSLMYLYEQCYV